MAQVHRGRFGVMLFGALVARLLVSGPLSAQAPYAENQHGFPPNSTFAVNGLDNVNLFSGNLVETIPLGPNYPIGAGFSHQLHLVYNSKIWTGRVACYDSNANELSGTYVSGSPVVGAGWTIEVGHLKNIDLAEESPDNAEGAVFRYKGPDGSTHSFFGPDANGNYTTTDRSFLRAKGVLFGGGKLASAEVDFPSGDKAFFQQPIAFADVNHGASVTQPSATSRANDFDSDGLYLRKLQSPEGDYYLVNYTQVADGSLQVSWIEHFRQGIPLRSITFSYKTVHTSGIAWSVIGEIDFPSVGGQIQRVMFDYIEDGAPAIGFPRPGTDLTGNAFGCTSGPKSLASVSAPLLKSVKLDRDLSPALTYSFTYLQAGSGTDLQSKGGVLAQLTVPTGGQVQYGWDSPGIGDLPPSTPVNCGMGKENRHCLRAWLLRTVGVSQRTEYPDGPSGAAYVWTYARHRYITSDALGPKAGYQITEMVPPPEAGSSVSYPVWHYFDLQRPEDSISQSHGLEFDTRYFSKNLSTSVLTWLRRTVPCYEGDTTNADVCPLDPTVAGSAGFPFGWANIRESITSTSTIQSNVPLQTKKIVRSDWNALGHFGKEEIFGWDGVSLRTSTTTWTPNTTDWLLDLYSKRTEKEANVTINRLYDFDTQTGFLKGSLVWDGTLQKSLRNCRYRKISGGIDIGGGVVDHEYWELIAASTLPSIVGCAMSTPSGFIGLDNHAFGKVYGYLNGQLTTAKWFKDTEASAAPNGPLAWFATDQTRDPFTGLITSWRDTASVATTYSFDILGRVRTIQPSVQGGVPKEAATSITYDSVTQVTVTRNGSDTNNTWSQFLYDGFARLTKEQRQLPSTTAFRIYRFDGLGREFFASEWTCTDSSTCPNSNAPPGTTLSDYTAFGRPQLIRKADGQTTTLTYCDDDSLTTTTCTGPPSDTMTKTTITVGTQPSTTVTRFDVLGRVVTVGEPAIGGTVDRTDYTYSVLDKLTRVVQGSQVRTFDYAAFGFLSQEVTPEKGTIKYEDYGALGNLVRSKEVTPNLILTHAYEAAGRLTGLSSNEAGSTTYVTNTYDQTGNGASAGKLTTQVAQNPNVATTVTDTFTYGGIGGRLSKQVTQLAGALNASATQKWAYNSLGLLASHHHPRSSGIFVVSNTYAAGLPVSIQANGLPAVTGITYQPSGSIAGYATGTNTGQNVTTKIEMSTASMLSRPSRISASAPGISTPLFDTGAYSYDGAGNITAMSSDSFGYDARSRLICARFGTPCDSSPDYTYDRWGNLLKNRSRTHTVDAKNQVTSGGAAYERGNLKFNGSEAYSWDGLDRMWSYRPDTDPAHTYKYVYNGANERLLKVLPLWAGGGLSVSLRDHAHRVATEQSGATASRDNVFLGHLLVASYANCSLGAWNCQVNSQPVGPWQYYSSDHLGTPRLISDAGGRGLDLRKYWPYGEEYSGSGDSAQRLKFASMERDAEGSRYYDHARSHEFLLGRFLSPDLLQGHANKPGTWNRYTYAGNSPLSKVDPNGLADDYFAAAAAKRQEAASERQQVRPALEVEASIKKSPVHDVGVRLDLFRGNLDTFVNIHTPGEVVQVGKEISVRNLEGFGTPADSGLEVTTVTKVGYKGYAAAVDSEGRMSVGREFNIKKIDFAMMVSANVGKALDSLRHEAQAILNVAVGALQAVGGIDPRTLQSTQPNTSPESSATLPCSSLFPCTR